MFLKSFYLKKECVFAPVTQRSFHGCLTSRVYPDKGSVHHDYVTSITYNDFDQRAAGTSYHERYTFTGKERDEETGYGYFGARYMDHDLMTLWLSVDPVADK